MKKKVFGIYNNNSKGKNEIRIVKKKTIYTIYISEPCSTEGPDASEKMVWARS